MKKLILTLLALFAFNNLYCKVSLPSILGDGMVLQRNTSIIIRGNSDLGKKVTVSPSWNGKKYQSNVDDQGNWSVSLETPDAGGPYVITIDDGELSSLENILIGDVWVCSGQSNMEMPVRGLHGQYTDRSMQSQLEANKYPNIRLFTVKKDHSGTPLDDCTGEWKQTSPGNVGDFSAVAWFFGKIINDVTDIPIGLISSNWGGTLIEPWISPDGILDIQNYQDPDPNLVKAHPMMGSGRLYNAMISPLTYLPAKGFLWYQGESNRNNPNYDKLMEGLVSSWRSAWNNQNMPFYFVEIAPFPYEDPRDLSRPLLIEMQHRAVKLIPSSGIAGTADLGDSITIHPPYKYEIGERLALHALVNDYGITGLEHQSPTAKDINYTDDGKVMITFENAPYGFIHEEELYGFEVAGEDRIFYPANAKVVYTQNLIEVISTDVPKPVAVRYAFRNWSSGNLYNISGLPALPFRSDSWDDVK